MTTKQERSLLAILASIQFTHIVDFMILMPLGAQLMRLFQISPGQFGLLVSSYTFAAGVAGFLAAFFIDRVDRKNAALFFFFGFAVGTLGCALSPNYHTLLFARAVTGAFGGVLGSLTNTIVGDAIPYHRRGAAMGIIMSAFSVASVLGVPFSLYLASHFSWHAPFIFLGIFSIIVWTAIFKLVPPMRDHMAVGSKRESPLNILVSIFTNSNQVMAIFFIFVLVFGQFVVIPFLSPSLVANTAMTEAQLPLLYLIGGGLTFFTSPLIGRLADKYGKKKIFLIFVTISWVPVYVITNFKHTPVLFILPFTALFFVCMGGRMIPAMAAVTSTVMPAKRGSFMSILNCFQQLAAALASFAGGALIVKAPTGELLNYNKVGYLGIICSFIAMPLMQKIKSVEGKNDQHLSELIAKEISPLEPEVAAPIIKQ